MDSNSYAALKQVGCDIRQSAFNADDRTQAVYEVEKAVLELATRVHGEALGADAPALGELSDYAAALRRAADVLDRAEPSPASTDQLSLSEILKRSRATADHYMNAPRRRHPLIERAFRKKTNPPQ